MKRLRMVLSMICFGAGLLTVVVGIFVIVVPLSAFAVANMDPLHHQPFSELVLAALPGVGVALVGFALLVCSRALDERGPVRRYGKRKAA